MIQYIEGNIFESPAQVIVNTVNTVGVMGKGLALSFKQRYPEMFKRYRSACEKNQLTIGKLMLVYEPDHWILLFPTKESWRKPSKLEYLEKGLMKFANTYADKNITSIAFPRLGCGNGELSWDDVKPLMEKYLKPLPIDIYIYLGVNPDDVPEHHEQKKTLSWLKENARDMSFIGLKDDISILCGLTPYDFQVLDKDYSVVYNEGLNFLGAHTKETIFVSESNFYKIWDDIRSKSIFANTSNITEETLVYAFLCSLGYLSKIRLLDSKTNEMINGYQINEGSGRIFSLKENG